MAVVKMTGKTQAVLDAEAAAEAKQIASDEARAYLRDTDWYIIRNVETGEPIPAEVTDRRTVERLKASEIRMVE